jgi:hypothetical protein
MGRALETTVTSWQKAAHFPPDFALTDNRV